MKQNTTKMRSRAGISCWLLLGLLVCLLPLPAYGAKGTETKAVTSLLTAIGIGQKPVKASSPTQARAMAERGAFLDAIRKLAERSGRQAPLDYGGPFRVGTTVQGFRIAKIVQDPDGTVEMTVSLSAPAKAH